MDSNKARVDRTLLLEQLGLVGLIGASVALALTTEYVMPLVLLLGLGLLLLWQMQRRAGRGRQRHEQWLAAALAGDLPLTEIGDMSVQRQIARLKRRNEGHQAKEEQQRLFLDAILQHLDLAVLVLDQQGNIVRHNRAWLTLLGGHSPADLAGLAAEAAPLRRWLGEAEPSPRALLQWQHRPLLACLSRCQIQGQSLRVITLQSIAAELAAQEQRAWQQMVRVLTHEIRNSITPIASLAGSAQALVSADAALDREEREDLAQALATVERRARALGRFINDYQQLAQVPKPEQERLNVADWLSEGVGLMQGELAGIDTELEIAEGLVLTADRTLLDQLLINLLRNAIEAVRGQPEPKITLTALRDAESRVVVQLQDNGIGVAPEAEANLFVPFFSTKPGGSGIGLSLARQIMQAHGGEIYAGNGRAPQPGFLITLRFR
ncbi:sensor histidine kinase [Ferrimonas pelagia]|uniref:histidine kinase n=1 Tax=Ferrimonas pelagia TaxID=1177826 RepID=A0ABP9FG40_9GAMM